MSDTTETSLSRSLTRFFRIVRRDHTRLTLTVLALAIDIALTVGFAALFTDLNNQSNHTQMISCIDGNHVRSSEKRLWVYVFTKIEPKHPTPAQLHAYDAFYVFLDKSLMPRDCKTL